jgi:hypothetical protein
MDFNHEPTSALYESYMANTKPVDDLPVSMKEYNQFTDTIAENFFGQQTMVTKMLNKVSLKDRLISRLKERLGPIMLKMKSGNLVDDWLESSRSQVDDYKVDQSKVI